VNTCRSWFVGSRSERLAYIVLGEAGLIESVASPQVIISDEIPIDVQHGIKCGERRLLYTMDLNFNYLYLLLGKCSTNFKIFQFNMFVLRTYEIHALGNNIWFVSIAGGFRNDPIRSDVIPDSRLRTCQTKPQQEDGTGDWMVSCHVGGTPIRFLSQDTA